MPQPDLPHPSHLDTLSALSRKYGPETANYYGASPLNRVSFLRSDRDFLSTAFAHSATRFLIFRDLSPLSEEPTEIAFVQYVDIAALFPKNPFERPESEVIAGFDSTSRKPMVVFLGLDERVKQEEGFSWRTYNGGPRFAVDITPRQPYFEAAETLIAELEKGGSKFLAGPRAMDFPADQAAMYAMSRSLLDWNTRNPFCAGCGQLTLSVHAGAKRVCPATDAGHERPTCPTRGQLSNLTFPRTDPTIIVAVLSADSRRVLLGRQKRWPLHWWSTLAGFVEAGESLEDAVRREVWEESGVRVGRVVVHSSQPWPYPASLMIGAIAQVVGVEGEEVILKNDPELEAARWFGKEEIREALRVGTSGLGDEPDERYKEGNLRLPPRTAIANQLITAVLKGELLAEGK